MTMKLPANYDKMSSKARRACREQYIEEQKGLCCYCKAPLTGPPAPEVEKLGVHTELYPTNFFKNPVHLHHNHTTGMTIGATHCHCNAVLFEYHGE